jgi:hypothetical protein
MIDPRDPQRRRLSSRLLARVLGYRPSASMIVALVALFVAMGGTTYAVRSLPSKSVGSKQIRNKAVHTRHIKARNVTRTKIARNAVDSSLVRRDSIHGSDILEASLATVPSAKDAANAANAAKVGGRIVEKFSFVAPGGTAATNVLTLSGLSLTVTCNAPPALSVIATTSVGGAVIHASGSYAPGTAWYQADDSFDVTDTTFSPLPAMAAGSNISGVITYVRQDGEVVTVTFLAQETATGCVFAGTAIG